MVLLEVALTTVVFYFGITELIRLYSPNYGYSISFGSKTSTSGPEYPINIIAPLTDNPRRDIECAICLDPLHKAQEGVRSMRVCKHQYCGGCIEQWLSKNKRCPLCNQDCDMIPISEIHEIESTEATTWAFMQRI